MRIVTGCLLLLTLAGCTSSEPVPVKTFVATSHEAIPRDGVEELAIDAVREYFDTSANIAADGGAGPERIAAVVTANWLPEEVAGFEALRALGASQLGTPLVTKIQVAAVRGIAAVTEVVLHVCTSMEGVAILTRDGDESDVPLGVSLLTVYVIPESGVFKVDAVEPWTEVTWCGEA
ncbi:MAG: hypothetical protein RLZZ587_724 [Actinomycetota bacterium]|jgi:hypothetical protein